MNAAGSQACAAITLTDELVLARSVFEHSVTYRSAMIYRQPRLVTDSAGKLAGVRMLTEHVISDAWDYARRPSRTELAAIWLLARPLAEASVKIRTAPRRRPQPRRGAGPVGGRLPLASTWPATHPGSRWRPAGPAR